MGSDEILARNLENTEGGTKRKTRLDSEFPRESKRLKRSLIDSYLIKSDNYVKKKDGEEDDEDEEEEEFEVQSIIDLKRSQVSPLITMRPRYPLPPSISFSFLSLSLQLIVTIGFILTWNF